MIDERKIEAEIAEILQNEGIDVQWCGGRAYATVASMPFCSSRACDAAPASIRGRVAMSCRRCGNLEEDRIGERTELDLTAIAAKLAARVG